MKKIFLIGAHEFIQGLFIHTLGSSGIQVLTISNEDELCALQDTPVDLIIVSLSGGMLEDYKGAPVCYLGTKEELDKAHLSKEYFIELPIAPLHLEEQLLGILKLNTTSL